LSSLRVRLLIELVESAPADGVLVSVADTVLTG
jgi:hypothetical protein